LVGRHGGDLVLNDRPVTFTGINGPGVPTTAPDEGTLDGCTKFTDTFVQSLFQTSPPDQLFRVWFFQAFALTKTTPQTLNWTGMDRLVRWAAQYHQHLDVTLSNQWSDCDSGVAHDLSWYQGGYDQTVTKTDTNIMSYASWIQLVLARYGNNPAIAMWEPVNEQNGTATDGTCDEPAAAQALTSFNGWFVNIARTYSPRKLVSSGSGGMGCGSMGADWVATQQSFDVWSFHYYDSTSPANIASHSMAATAGQNSRPVIVGETGISIGTPRGTPCQTTTAELRARLLQSQQTAFFASGVGSVLFWVLDMAQPPPSTCSDYINPADPAFGLMRPG
jgi:endo-1,4-beta-mannosidase